MILANTAATGIHTWSTTGTSNTAMTHQAREVHDRALPDRSREANETSGIDLMQKSEGRKVLDRK